MVVVMVVVVVVAVALIRKFELVSRRIFVDFHKIALLETEVSFVASLNIERD